jgi:hypothetical protein
VKRTFLVLLLFSSLVLPSIMSIPSAKAQSQAIIMPNHTGYMDNTTIPPTYHVVGEVSNTGTVSLRLPNVSADFYAQNNSLIGSSSSYAFLDVLLPGRKAPFETVWIGSSASQIHNYSLSLSFDDYAIEKPLALQILESSAYKDEAGFMKVNGTVKNLGKSNATAVKVVTTFYDIQSRVIGVASDYTSPPTIMPDNTEGFELELKHKISSFSNYNLAAESVEYTSFGAGITINYGATFSTGTSVTLVLHSNDLSSSLVRMRFSNNNITFPDWEPYAPSKAWILAEEDGVKTVYAQFMDDMGSVSSYYDTITLDSTPPTITVVSPVNASVVNFLPITIVWAGQDATSGVRNYETKMDNASWLDVQLNTTMKFENLTQGDHTVYVKAMDNAGLSSQAFISFKVDLTGSSVPLNLEGIVILATIAIVLVVAVLYIRRTRRSRHSRHVRSSHRR